MKLNLAVFACQPELRKKETGETVIRGLAIPYNRDSSPIWGMFIERFLPGSVETLKSNDEVFAYVEHNSNMPLARRSNGTLNLIETEDGVIAETLLNNTTYAQDLAENIRSGVIKGMSFGFRCLVEEWDDRPKMPIRSVKKCEISEVTYTHNPAYPDTTASLRSGFIDKAEAAILLPKTRGITLVDYMKIRGV